MSMQRLSRAAARTTAARGARVPAASRTLHASARVEFKTQQDRGDPTIEPKDDLGGPYGQAPIYNKPSSAPDIAKRNWAKLAGGAFVAVAGMWYLTQPTDGKKGITKGKELDNQAREKAKELKHDARGEADKAMDKMGAVGEQAKGLGEDAKKAAENVAGKR